MLTGLPGRNTGAILCLITDRRRLSDPDSPPSQQGDALLRLIASACEAGIDLVQIRERDLEGGALFDLTVRAVELARSSRTRILVNDRLDIAIAAGAHGVHLRGDSIAPARARVLAPPGFLIGRSVHSAPEAADAGSSGAVDFLIFGTVFPTGSKGPEHAVSGLEGLREAVRATSLPVLGVGGITEASCRVVAGTGAAGIAAIGLFGMHERPGRSPAARFRDLATNVRLAFDTGKGVV